MNLIEDVFIMENMQILNEGRGVGPMKIRGCFQRADEENNNKRIYPKALLQREMDKLADAITERRLMGELDHPQHDSVKLNNVSHLITKLEMKGNEVIGEAEILNTPAGQVVKALIEGGVKVGISSRGLGTLSEGSDGKRYVNEDFKLVTWDMVADPSTRGAYPGLTESTEITRIIDDVLPRAKKVENFKVLLREEFNRIDEKKKAIAERHSFTYDDGIPSREEDFLTPSKSEVELTAAKRKKWREKKAAEKAAAEKAAPKKPAKKTDDDEPREETTMSLHSWVQSITEKTRARKEYLKRKAAGVKKPGRFRRPGGSTTSIAPGSDKPAASSKPEDRALMRRPNPSRPHGHRVETYIDGSTGKHRGMEHLSTVEKQAKDAARKKKKKADK